MLKYVRHCFTFNPILKSPDDYTKAFISQHLIDLNRLNYNLSAINWHDFVMSENQFTLFFGQNIWRNHSYNEAYILEGREHYLQFYCHFFQMISTVTT